MQDKINELNELFKLLNNKEKQLDIVLADIENILKRINEIKLELDGYNSKNKPG